MSRQARRQAAFILVFLAVVVLFVNTFRLGIVHGESMYPTYLNGQVVLVRRYNMFCPRLKRYDVILLRQGNDVIIKRVYRLPGEVVDTTFPDVKDQAIRTGLSDYYEQHTTHTPSGKKVIFTVPPGYIIVLGDNLPVSDDSRVFGPVPIKNVLGIVVNSPPPPYQPRLGGPGMVSPR